MISCFLIKWSLMFSWNVTIENECETFLYLVLVTWKLEGNFSFQLYDQFSVLSVSISHSLILSFLFPQFAKTTNAKDLTRDERREALDAIGTSFFHRLLKSSKWIFKKISGEEIFLVYEDSKTSNIVDIQSTYTSISQVCFFPNIFHVKSQFFFPIWNGMYGKIRSDKYLCTVTVFEDRLDEFKHVFIQN